MTPFARRRRNTGRGGFTLIELLIVIAIILILIAIALPNFMAARTRAVVAQVQGEIRSISIALESYATDHQAKYPHLPGNVVAASGNQFDRNGIHLAYNLTTPIKYLDSEVIKRGDPFLGNYEYDSNGRLTDGLGGPPSSVFYSYGYINITLRRQEQGIQITQSPQYAILSVGPDVFKGPHPDTGNRWNYSRYGGGPVGPYFQSRFEAWMYSATNGTRSGGDIARFQ